MTRYDCIVVGSGPNGLAAAITVARAGHSVLVLEAEPTLGGACRSAALTEPGFVHDVGSSIHPLAVASPFMTTIPWADHGLEWIESPAAAAHPIDRGPAAVAWRDLDRTVEGFGVDGPTYRKLTGSLVQNFDRFADLVLRAPLEMIEHPIDLLRWGPRLALPASLLIRRFKTDRARGLLAGHAAHSILPLGHPFSGAFAQVFAASAHAVGWPFPRGGAGEITRVMAEVLLDAGGKVETGRPVESIDDLPPTRTVLFALTPRQIDRIVGDRFPAKARARRRRFRYGPGACKVDYALSEPIPWSDPGCREAATVHLGGTFEEVAAAEAEVAAGRHARHPFVLLAQHTLFDPDRAPDGAHTAWAYCHVPNGSTIDVSATIERQIERFAPGFRDTVVARTVSLPGDLERRNGNLVGGDIGGGSYSGLQLPFRPTVRPDPYRTELDHVFIGSASTSPGAGVHGMAGHRAGLRALATLSSTA